MLVDSRAAPKLLSGLVWLLAVSGGACGGDGAPTLDASVAPDGATPDGGAPPDTPPSLTFEVLDPPHGGNLRGLWGSSASDVWIGTPGVSLLSTSSLLHWNGTDFTVTSTGVADSILGISGTAPDDVWAVGTLSDGSNATILHYDGSELAISRQELGTGTYRAVFARSRDEVWVVGDDTVLRYDGATWSRPPEGPTPLDVTGYTVVGAGPTDVWILGSYAAWRWNGTKLATAPAPLDLVTGAWAAGANDIWAAGKKGLHRYQGGEWTLVRAAPDFTVFRAIWGRSPEDLWIVGEEANAALAEHWNGSTWTRATLEYETGGGVLAQLTGVWGTAEEVWIIGTHGTVLRGR